MKKLLTALLLLSIIAPVSAETFFEISWEDIAPAKYANIDLEKRYWSGDAKYWVGRKKTFDRNLAVCQSFAGSKRAACFEELSNDEYGKNNAHNEFIQARQMQYAVMQAARYLK